MKNTKAKHAGSGHRLMPTVTISFALLMLASLMFNCSNVPRCLHEGQRSFTTVPACMAWEPLALIFIVSLPPHVAKRKVYTTFDAPRTRILFLVGKSPDGHRSVETKTGG